MHQAAYKKLGRGGLISACFSACFSGWEELHVPAVVEAVIVDFTVVQERQSSLSLKSGSRGGRSFLI